MKLPVSSWTAAEAANLRLFWFTLFSFPTSAITSQTANSRKNYLDDFAESWEAKQLMATDRPTRNDALSCFWSEAPRRPSLRMFPPFRGRPLDPGLRPPPPEPLALWTGRQLRKAPLLSEAKFRHGHAAT